jgi:hypothetical protein
VHVVRAKIEGTGVDMDSTKPDDSGKQEGTGGDMERTVTGEEWSDHSPVQPEQCAGAGSDITSPLRLVFGKAKASIEQSQNSFGVDSVASYLYKRKNQSRRNHR